MSGSVLNNIAQSRYELHVDGQTAYVSYERDGKVLRLNHTLVPPELGGRGVGSRLLQGALDVIRSEGSRIVPVCSFAAKFIDQHPEYRDLVQV